MKSEATSIPTIYKTLNHIVSFDILFDNNTEITVVQMETNNQNNAVKSFALKLFSTILPNSSNTGHPQPNHSTMNCWFAQLYGIRKTANNKSGATRTAIFFINFIQTHSFVKFKFMQLTEEQGDLTNCCSDQFLMLIIHMQVNQWISNLVKHLVLLL